MSLRDVRYQEDYRTGYDDLLADFYKPSLSNANEYWRAVGYFSSSALELFGEPLAEFVIRGGHIKLITSVELSEADLSAISRGQDKEAICAQRIAEIVRTEFAEGVGDGTTRLLRLLQMERLEIRIAVPKIGTGIYHEKIGVFFDDSDDLVAFSGSSNESRNALENNRECLDVFPSWELPGRAKRKYNHFSSLWNGTDLGVYVYSFPEASKRKLLRIHARSQSNNRQGSKKHVIERNKWKHQEEALEIFLREKRGILNMATGTGKTRTAIDIVHSLSSNREIETVVVCTDGNDLLDQWYKEILKANERLGYKVYRHYRTAHDSQKFLLSPSKSIMLASRHAIANILKRFPTDRGESTLLIHDEVHGLGSPHHRRTLDGLTEGIRYRLGLSATPEREYDQEGNSFLTEHIGPTIYKFGLEDAIKKKILVPFEYYPLTFRLSEDDRERIQRVYKRKSARAREGAPMTEEEVWIEIAKVYKSSESKIPVFDEFLKNQQHFLERCIVFTETQEFGNKVCEVVHKYRPNYHTYYSGQHSETLDGFARGDLECLITCHRISEGIDIRSVNTAVLFSSARSRLETIQRIGRCLRTNPEDDNKAAQIIDFICESEDDQIRETDEQRRGWLSEISRITPEE